MSGNVGGQFAEPKGLGEIGVLIGLKAVCLTWLRDMISEKEEGIGAVVVYLLAQLQSIGQSEI